MNIAVDAMQYEKKKKQVSLIVALLFASKMLNIVFANFFGVTNKPGILVLGFIWILLIRYLFVNKLFISVPRSAFAFICLIILYIIFSNCIASGHIVSLTFDFFEFCLLGFIIGGLDFDMEYVTTYCCYLLLLLAYPIYDLVTTDLARWQHNITIDNCYAVAPLIFAVIMHFFKYRTNAKIIHYVAYAVAFIALVIFGIRGVRGFAILILVYLLLMIANRKNSNKRSRGVMSFILICLLFLFIISFNPIMSFVFGKLQNVDIEIVQKSMRLFESGDLSNGRTDLFLKALKGFANSPLIGNGIGRFWDNYPADYYPHNIIFQVLYEGGLVLGIPIIGMVLKGLYDGFYTDMNENAKQMFIMCLVCGVIPSMISNEYWVYPLLWIMFGMILVKKY